MDLHTNHSQLCYKGKISLLNYSETLTELYQFLLQKGQLKFLVFSVEEPYFTGHPTTLIQCAIKTGCEYLN